MARCDVRPGHRPAPLGRRVRGDQGAGSAVSVRFLAAKSSSTSGSTTIRVGGKSVVISIAPGASGDTLTTPSAPGRFASLVQSTRIDIVGNPPEKDHSPPCVAPSTWRRPPCRTGNPQVGFLRGAGVAGQASAGRPLPTTKPLPPGAGIAAPVVSAEPLQRAIFNAWNPSIDGPTRSRQTPGPATARGAFVPRVVIRVQDRGKRFRRRRRCATNRSGRSSSATGRSR